MRILVLGAGGMLGSSIFQFLANSPSYEVFGSLRSNAALNFLPSKLHPSLLVGFDMENEACLKKLFTKTKPAVVINCVGLVKHLVRDQEPLHAININAVLPHRLAELSAQHSSRFIHISTDCVFSGNKGMYSELENCDAMDLYGRTKYLGEVDYSHAITLRTSIIGHELIGSSGLIGWFLSQEQGVKGYRNAIFSGLPTIEVARIIRDYVVPHPHLRGVYQISAAPINKYDLLTLVAKIYEKKIDIFPDEQLKINRSLNSSKFYAATGYSAPDWLDLIKVMHLNK